MLDIKKLEQFMEKIELPAEGCAAVKQYAMTEDQYENWYRMFYEEPDEFFRVLDKEQGKEQLVLYLYVRFAMDIHGEYQKRQITDQVYYDTFKDISIWFGQCWSKKGIYGLIEERWLALPLKLRIFRLGRLQFEPEILEADKEVNGYKMLAGTGVLHVHIPEGEPLKQELCDAAFAQADTFFSGQYTLYDCWSWLLSPNLYEVLEADSNILKFQRRFTIHQVSYQFRMAEERIFGFIAERPQQYKDVGTSLQKRAKAYVAEGNDLGIGYGTIYRKHL